ncbi:hypothetical protein HDU93_001841 [Gonapodya sp. JEL0774]|nr:hypothetical protein HDU93_001841 [Gonapodya sp. JEL0774]
MDPSYSDFLDNARIRIAVVPVHPLRRETYLKICSLLNGQFTALALQDLPVSAATEAQGKAAAAGAVGGGTVNFNFTSHLASASPPNAYIYLHFLTPSTINSLQHSTGARFQQPQVPTPVGNLSLPGSGGLASQAALAGAAATAAAFSNPDSPIIIDGTGHITGSRYDDFAAGRQVLAVVGIASCVDCPDLPAAATTFKKTLQKYPTALSSRLLAFDPLPTTPDSTRGVVLVPSEGRPPEFYLQTIITDMVAEVIAAFGIVASNWERRREVYGPRGAAVAGTPAAGGVALGGQTSGGRWLPAATVMSAGTPQSTQGPTYPSLDHPTSAATLYPPRTPTLTPSPSSLLVNGLPASALGQQTTQAQVHVAAQAVAQTALERSLGSATASQSPALSGAPHHAAPTAFHLRGASSVPNPSPLGRSVAYTSPSSANTERSMEDVAVRSMEGGLEVIGNGATFPVPVTSAQIQMAETIMAPSSPPPYAATSALLERPVTPPHLIPVRANAPSPPPQAFTSPPTSPTGETFPSDGPFAQYSSSFAYPYPYPPPSPALGLHSAASPGPTSAVSKLARRRAPARFQKLLGDLLLLSGRTVEAMQTYTAAVEGCRQTGDAVWAAGAQEGYLAAVMVAAAARVGVGMYTLNSRYAMSSTPSLDNLASPAITAPSRRPATSPTPPENTPLRTLISDLPDRYREIIGLYEKVTAQPAVFYGPGGVGSGGGLSSVAGILGLSGVTMGFSSVFSERGDTEGPLGPPPPLATRSGTALSVAGQPMIANMDGQGGTGPSAPGTAVTVPNGAPGPISASNLPQHPWLICNAALRMARFLAALHRARTPIVFTNSAGYFLLGTNSTVEKITGGLVGAASGNDVSPGVDSPGVTKTDVASWLAKCWNVASSAERFGTMTTAEKTVVAGYVAAVYGNLGMVRKEAFFLRVAAQGAATSGWGAAEGAVAWSRQLDMGKNWNDELGSNESLENLEERALKFSKSFSAGDLPQPANELVDAGAVEVPGVLECYNRILDVLGGGTEINVSGLPKGDSPGTSPTSSPPQSRRRTPAFSIPTPEDDFADYGYLNDPMTPGDLLNEKLHPFILTSQKEASGVFDSFGSRYFNLYPVSRPFSSSSQVKFGWPELQAATLRECLDVARMLGDLPNAVVYAARLLRRLHQHMPAQEQADIAETMRKLVVRRKARAHFLGDDEEGDGTGTVPIVRSVVGGLCGVPVVRSIDAVRVGPRLRTHEHVVSGGRDDLIKDRDPFIFNPYLNKGSGGTMGGARSSALKEEEAVVVAGEVVHWDIVLANPFGFELDVQSAIISADVELNGTEEYSVPPAPDYAGIESNGYVATENSLNVHQLSTPSFTNGFRPSRLFKPSSLSFTIPARHRNFQIRLSGVAHVPSKLRVHGVIFKVLGGSLLEEVVPLPVKLSGENGDAPTQNGKKIVTTGEDKERAVGRRTILFAKEDKGRRRTQNGPPIGLQTAIMLFEGERTTFAVTVENVGSTPVNYLTIHFVEDCDPTATPFALFQRQLQESTDSLISTDETNPNGDIREPPEDIYERDVFEKSCRGIWRSVVVVFDYGFLPNYSKDGVLPPRFFTRRLALPLLVTVNRALEVANVDVFPFASSGADIGSPQPLNEAVSADGSLKDLIVNEFGHSGVSNRERDVNEQTTQDFALGINSDSSLRSTEGFSNYVNRDFCLFTFDLRNKWSTPFDVEFGVAGLGQGTEQGAKWIIRLKIEGGGTRRIVLPLRRSNLPTSLTYLPIPYPPTQFVLSKLIKYSSEQELLHRALFWYREKIIGGIELEGLVSARWRSSGGRHGGLISAIRNFRLTGAGLTTLSEDILTFEVSLQTVQRKSQSGVHSSLIKSLGLSTFEVPRRTSVELKWAIRNQRDTPIRLCMRVVPVQDTGNGLFEYGDTLRESVIWNGNLESVLGTISPNETCTYKLGATFLSLGRYKLLVHCQEIDCLPLPSPEPSTSKLKPKDVDLASLGKSAAAVAGDGIYWPPEPVLIKVI